ncbi:unnamed protein product [Mytilus edulis]|uniref:Uncharacterized protein n=1 Tax=Mytilus edulis TaxID=6550 RepID=A0A8S3T7W8_MYTED|nr:unnamed protein product [Mytilus edulis]
MYYRLITSIEFVDRTIGPLTYKVPVFRLIQHSAYNDVYYRFITRLCGQNIVPGYIQHSAFLQWCIIDFITRLWYRPTMVYYRLNTTRPLAHPVFRLPTMMYYRLITRLWIEHWVPGYIQHSALPTMMYYRLITRLWIEHWYLTTSSIPPSYNDGIIDYYKVVTEHWYLATSSIPLS